MKKRKSLLRSDSFQTLLTSLLCIILGVAIGYVVLLIINPAGAWKSMSALLKNFFHYPAGKLRMKYFGQTLVRTAPLLMCALSILFAYKVGMFNIGAAGQYVAGACVGLYAAIAWQLPWYLCLLAAMLFGAIWGALPGIFKAYLNINEVITAIMFNWIGLYMVNDIMYGKGKSPMYDLASTKTYSLRKAAPQAMIPSLGMSELFGKLQSVTIAIFIAIFFAIVVYIILNKTAFGYELRACGFNKNAARYAGINEKRNIILAMMISGALAGVGAGLYYLSTVAEWNPQVSTALPAMGFNGISTALLACSNPIGTIFSSLFISYITVGGTKLSTQYYTKEIADVITALIIYLCAFSLLFKNKIRALLVGKAKRVSVGKGGDD